MGVVHGADAKRYGAKLNANQGPIENMLGAWQNVFWTSQVRAILSHRGSYQNYFWSETRVRHWQLARHRRRLKGVRKFPCQRNKRH
jgi:hypothetical protein